MAFFRVHGFLPVAGVGIVGIEAHMGAEVR